MTKIQSNLNFHIHNSYIYITLKDIKQGKHRFNVAREKKEIYSECHR